MLVNAQVLKCLVVEGDNSSLHCFNYLARYLLVHMIIVDPLDEDPLRNSLSPTWPYPYHLAAKMNVLAVRAV